MNNMKKKLIKILLDPRRKASAAPVSQYYVFDASATSYMNTDFDVNGLDNQSVVVRARLTLNTGSEKYFVGVTNHVSKMYFSYLPTDRFQARLIQVGDSNLVTNAANWTYDELWHQFAFTYNGTNLSVYVDGALIETIVDADFNGFTTSRPVQIGMGGNDTARGLTGEMSDYQHYNKALSVPELQALNTDITDTTTGLVVNFAGQKASGTWTDEVSGFEATNAGGVTLV